jgi:uncharacterized Zn-finger protein
MVTGWTNSTKTDRRKPSACADRTQEERIHRCSHDGCGATFSSNSTARRHERNCRFKRPELQTEASNPYFCTGCKKTFPRDDYVMRHITNSTKDSRPACAGANCGDFSEKSRMVNVVITGAGQTKLSPGMFADTYNGSSDLGRGQRVCGGHVKHLEIQMVSTSFILAACRCENAPYRAASIPF